MCARPGQEHRLALVVPRGRDHVVGGADPVALGSHHQHRRHRALGQEPVQPQRQVHQRARRFDAQVQRRLGEDARVDVAAEVERTQRVEHVRRHPRRVEATHLHQVIGILRGQPRGHRQQARRRDRRDQRRRAHGPRAEQPLDHRGAHRMADQHRRDGRGPRRRARRRPRSRRVRRRTASRDRPRRRARAATARTTDSPAARSTAGNAAPSTRRRSSRRGRTAAVAGARRGGRCGCAPAGASGLRGGIRRGASGGGWRGASGTAPRQGARAACYDSAPSPCPPHEKSPFCQKRRRPARRTTPAAAAVRASRRSSTRCARSIPATSAGRCRRSAMRPRAC